MIDLNNNLSLEDNIVLYLFDEIFSKKLQPGSKIAESVLAKDFNASREVVRKAFSQLQSMGILIYTKNQGFHVVWLSEEDTKNIYATRKILELGIIQNLTQKHAKGQLDLSPLSENIETEKYLKISLKNGEYVKTSCDFHMNLALLSDNEYLINALKPLIPLSILAGLIYDDNTTTFCSYEEHNALIKAIENHDVENSKSIMNQHLNHCVDALSF